MADQIPPNITFHPGAGETFRSLVLGAYATIYPAIRRRLESFAGAPTLIRTVDRPFLSRDVGQNWVGLSSSPATMREDPTTPAEDLTPERRGRHRLALSEHTSSGSPHRPALVNYSFHHELGHRIDAAIAGDNHPDSEYQRFSHSRQFIDALLADIRDARASGARLVGLAPYLHRLRPLGLDTPPDSPLWQEVAREVFADLYTARFTDGLDEQITPTQRARDFFDIFRRTSLLVDRAVSTFAGESLMPREPYASRDYPSGVGPALLVSTPDFTVITGETPQPPPGPQQAPGKLPLPQPR